MPCEDALKLVLEAQRAEQTGTLRAYADDNLRTVARETRSLGTQLEHAREIASQLEADDGAVCALSVAALSMRRNKRCVCAYHAQRLEALQRRFWASTASPHSLLAPDRPERALLAPGEADFLRAYSRLVTDFRGAHVDLLDLASPSLARPPRDLFVQVRVLKDVGPVVGDWGILDLRKNDLLSLMRPDVERLIVAGVLEEVSE